MSLKVDFHPRGHVAACNGKLDKLRVKVEQYFDDRGDAVEEAAHVEDWNKSERKRKELRLAQFRREVRNRVSTREKLIQEEMAVTSTKAMGSEHAAAEKAMNLDKTKIPHSVVKGHDIEDIKVTASGKESFLTATTPSALEMARKALLSNSSYSHFNDGDGGGDPSKQETGPRSDCASQKPHTNYQSVEQLSSENCSRRRSEERGTVSSRLSGTRIIKKYTPPGQLEHMQKKQAGNQYLLFRRLYSELEREQARKKQLQRSHNRHVEALKKKKESNRRMIEDEINATECFSIVSTDASEDQRRATEWAELMLLEERRQELQKAKEMERYVAALKARLRDQIERKKLSVSAICSCGDTVWDTNPQTCANNCIFYKNPKAYIRALSNLLQSLNIY